MSTLGVTRGDPLRLPKVIPSGVATGTPLPLATGIGNAAGALIVDALQAIVTEALGGDGKPVGDIFLNAANQFIIGVLLGSIFQKLPGARDLKNISTSLQRHIERIRTGVAAPSRSDALILSADDHANAILTNLQQQALVKELYAKAVRRTIALMTLDAFAQNTLPGLTIWIGQYGSAIWATIQNSGDRSATRFDDQLSE